MYSHLEKEGKMVTGQKKMMLTLALIVLLTLVACAPKAAPTSAPPATAASKPAAAPVAPSAPKPVLKEAWQVKWDAMVEGAKKEGSVVIYSTAGAEIRTALQRGFKEKFGIGAEFITGQAGEMGTKILAERRAGLRLGDVGMVGGTAAMSVIKPAGVAEPIEVGGVLILPEFSDPKLWLGGKLRWQDETTHLSLTFSLYEIEHLARNTELVKDGEIQSYNDLLNPKYKGKIIMRDPTRPGGGSKPVAMIGRYTMGWDYVRALAKQELLIMTDLRLQMDWLARGKYPIAFGYKTSELYDFKQMGLPVNAMHVREGGYLTAGPGIVMLLKEAAHPNAARLFINWLMTREGQTAFSRSGGYPSVRLDVSDEGMMYPRATPDSKAPDGDGEEAVLKQDEDQTIIREIFLPLLRK